MNTRVICNTKVQIIILCLAQQVHGTNVSPLQSEQTHQVSNQSAGLQSNETLLNSTFTTSAPITVSDVPPTSKTSYTTENISHSQILPTNDTNSMCSSTHAQVHREVLLTDTMFRCAPELLDKFPFVRTVREVRIDFRASRKDAHCRFIGRIFPSLRTSNASEMSNIPGQIPGWRVLFQTGPSPSLVASPFYVAMWVHIPKLRLSDSGTFTCRVVLGGGDGELGQTTETSATRLVVSDLPTQRRQSGETNRFVPRDTFIADNDDIVFRCHVDGTATVKKYTPQYLNRNTLGNPSLGKWTDIVRSTGGSNILAFHHQTDDPAFPLEPSSLQTFHDPRQGEIVVLLTNISCPHGMGLYVCQDSRGLTTASKLVVGLAPLSIKTTKRVDREAGSFLTVVLEGPLARRLAWKIVSSSCAKAKYGKPQFTNLTEAGVVALNTNNTGRSVAGCLVWQYQVHVVVQLDKGCEYGMAMELTTVMGNRKMQQVAKISGAPLSTQHNKTGLLMERRSVHRTSQYSYFITMGGVGFTVLLTCLITRGIFRCIEAGQDNSADFGDIGLTPDAYRNFQMRHHLLNTESSESSSTSICRKRQRHRGRKRRTSI